MGDKKKRQEICEGRYDEFLGHPDFAEDVKRGVNDHKYPVLSGNEGMHDVVKYATRLEAAAENAEPIKSAGNDKREAKRPARTDHLAEQLVHPDFTDETSEAAGKYSVIHGSESIQDGDEEGWH